MKTEEDRLIWNEYCRLLRYSDPEKEKINKARNYLKHKAALNAQSMERYYANREQILEQIKKRQSMPAYRAGKREYDKQRRAQMGEEYLQQHRDYYDRNKESINARRRTPEGRKKRAEEASRILKTRPNSRLATILRNRVRSAIRAHSKSLTTIELTGCSMEALREHLEKQFLPGMCWNNHTLKGWHIDHVIPCSAFNLSYEEEQRKCFNYNNLKPMWWLDNLKKSNKVL